MIAMGQIEFKLMQGTKCDRYGQTIIIDLPKTVGRPVYLSMRFKCVIGYNTSKIRLIYIPRRTSTPTVQGNFANQGPKLNFSVSSQQLNTLMWTVVNEKHLNLLLNPCQKTSNNVLVLTFITLYFNIFLNMNSK